LARRRLFAAVLCTALVAIPVAGLRAARQDGPVRTVEVAAVSDTAPPTTAEVAQHLESDRASRSDGWARRAIEELPLEDFAPSSTIPPTTARKATTVTTVARKAAAPTTTAAPRTTTTKAPASAPRRDAAPPTTSEANAQSGKASWYEAAPSGTCAHRTLPMGTIVHITNTANGRTATCRVADRGPYVNGWIIDLAKDVFSSLAPLEAGVISVRLTW
jgi:rare lipoprotein A